MLTAKVLNGFNMARMGRFDVSHNPSDDRVCVYFRTPAGPNVRVYIEADGSVYSEPVNGSLYDDGPLDGEPSTDEVVIGQVE